MDKVTSKFVNSHFYDQDYRDAWTTEGYGKLRTYLLRAAKGNPNIWTAPFAKGQSMPQILADWDKTLQSIAAEWPSLYEFEKDLASKVGPMSVQKPTRDRLDDIRHYYEDILLPSKPIDDRAIDLVIDEFSSIRGLRVRSPRKTNELMKKSTSSGSPWFTKKRKVQDAILPCRVIGYAGRHPGVDAYIQGHYWSQPAVLGWRGQEGGEDASDVKQRVVWMFPYAVNLEELRVYQPLIEACQKRNLVAPWVSNDAVDLRITRLFDTKGSDDLVICTDFSKFDQHFNQDMADAARSILRSLLTPGNDAETWLRDVFPCKYYIPLAWELGDMEDTISYFRGVHGMGSGSGGTNADETLTHRALQHEVAMLNNEILNPNSMCLGDDGVLTYPGITVEQVIDAYTSHGQECNPEKQYVSNQDCVFLRRWHHTNYRPNGTCAGVYSTMRALGRLRYLERYQDPEYWGPTMVALRQLSIIENCKWHPLFTDFIQFCMKRDKYRLGLDIPGFMDNITKYAREATDHMPDFLGYTKTLQGETGTGIADWAVVKYLKSL